MPGVNLWSFWIRDKLANLSVDIGNISFVIWQPSFLFKKADIQNQLINMTMFVLLVDIKGQPG